METMLGYHYLYSHDMFLLSDILHLIYFFCLKGLIDLYLTKLLKTLYENTYYLKLLQYHHLQTL